MAPIPNMRSRPDRIFLPATFGGQRTPNGQRGLHLLYCQASDNHLLLCAFCSLTTCLDLEKLQFREHISSLKIYIQRLCKNISSHSCSEEAHSFHANLESKKLLIQQIGTFLYGSKSQLLNYSAMA